MALIKKHLGIAAVITPGRTGQFEVIADGATTYFASDIAYFADKVSRGYDRLIVVLAVDDVLPDDGTILIQQFDAVALKCVFDHGGPRNTEPRLYAA